MGDTVIHALNDVSLCINANEFVSVVGPSGSGKSTLMNILGCLDVPDKGEYILDGVKVSMLHDNKLANIRNQKIGFIFQGFNLIPKLTAIENVELPLVYRGLSAKERLQRARTALEKVGLSDRLTHKPSELSGGQQQRVAIARALVSNPPIILADEPTGNLDSKSGSEIMNILKSLNRAGNTIIVITHDNHVAKMTDRIIRIQDGKVIENLEEI
jgi:putative ABC transport system ATP-binding protein